MHRAGLSAEVAFDKLAGGKQYLSKQRFCDEITKQRGVEFTAAELDLLFKYLDTNRDNRLDVKEWGVQLYEDAANPLALI